eukprot:scaffold2319_cov248-Pinguiococcus_pyrenoidosus.AAC.4
MHAPDTRHSTTSFAASVPTSHWRCEATDLPAADSSTICKEAIQEGPALLVAIGGPIVRSSVWTCRIERGAKE